jgi:hypothetical protein
MILFSLVLLYDQWLLPKIVINHHRRRTELDTVDHTLLWIIKIGMILFFITSPDLFEYTTTIATSDEASSTQRPPQEFFFACSGGDIDHVKESLQKSPQWANSRTENGETPLHLTYVYTSSDELSFPVFIVAISHYFPIFITMLKWDIWTFGNHQTVIRA